MDKKQISGYQGMRGGGNMGNNYLMDPGYFSGAMKISWKQRWWLHHTVNALNATELYTLKCLIICNVTCTLIKNKDHNSL